MDQRDEQAVEDLINRAMEKSGRAISAEMARRLEQFQEDFLCLTLKVFRDMDNLIAIFNQKIGDVRSQGLSPIRVNKGCVSQPSFTYGPRHMALVIESFTGSGKINFTASQLNPPGSASAKPRGITIRPEFESNRNTWETSDQKFSGYLDDNTLATYLLSVLVLSQ